MKTITAVVIAMIMTVTASAETWRQKVARLERANRNLKSQVAALTKQVIKLQKTNNNLMGDQEVPVAKAATELKKPAVKNKGKWGKISGVAEKLRKYHADKKIIESKIDRQKYSLASKAERKKQKKILLDQLSSINRKIREYEICQEKNKKK